MGGPPFNSENPQGYAPQGNMPGPYGTPPSYPPPPYGDYGRVAQPFGVAQPGYYAAQAPHFQPVMLPTECFGGFWMRFAAYLIDSLVVVLPIQVLSLAARVAVGLPLIDNAAMAGRSRQDPKEVVIGLVTNLVFIVGGWLYFALMHSKKGATLGKMALGLRVVDNYGMYPSLGRATGRYFATILSGCACYMGYILAAFDPHKRTWHDKLADTYVVLKDYVNPAQSQL